MRDALIQFKTRMQTKKKAKLLAEKLGLDLSAVLNALLEEFVRSKRLSIGLSEEWFETMEDLAFYKIAEERKRNPKTLVSLADMDKFIETLPRAK